MLGPRLLAAAPARRRLALHCTPILLRQLSSSPGDEPRSLWQRVKGMFSKPGEEETAARAEKAQILKERMKHSVFYDAKQSTAEKVREGLAFCWIGIDANSRRCGR